MLFSWVLFTVIGVANEYGNADKSDGRKGDNRGRKPCSVLGNGQQWGRTKNLRFMRRVYSIDVIVIRSVSIATKPFLIKGDVVVTVDGFCKICRTIDVAICGPYKPLLGRIHA